MDAVDIITSEVRDRIRATGIDPRIDTAASRDVIKAVIADYDERTLKGNLPVLSDPDEAFRSILDDVAGFGTLQKYLDDPDIEEIWINGPQAVFISRRGVSELLSLIHI